ncbi:MAG: hypothetical protein K8R21_03415 [Leptospira sp.]|nr:hypothetical protein [Leptospira sp.]
MIYNIVLLTLCFSILELRNCRNLPIDEIRFEKSNADCFNCVNERFFGKLINIGGILIAWQILT